MKAYHLNLNLIILVTTLFLSGTLFSQSISKIEEVENEGAITLNFYRNGKVYPAIIAPTPDE